MKFIIYNLGCKVNSYESNVMTENLENAGYILTDNVEEANIAIVNTCSVTNTADSKSLKTLRQVKKNNPNIIGKAKVQKINTLFLNSVLIVYFKLCINISLLIPFL